MELAAPSGGIPDWGVAARAPPGAHVQHADAGHDHPRLRATTARCSNWWPATGPGLLCDVGKVLWEERVDLQGARISTIGERAEDVFYVTDLSQQPLDDVTAEQLQAQADRGADAHDLSPSESGFPAAVGVSLRAACRA